ncbi:MAG: hypothetical protein LBB12_00685 [Holosporaceae bacterium]|nr:hypothetical protein [Holosporaceae bacterium]
MVKIVWAWRSTDANEAPAKCTGKFITGQDPDSLINFPNTSKKAMEIYANDEDTMQMANGDAKIIVELALVPKNYATTSKLSGTDKNPEAPMDASSESSMDASSGSSSNGNNAESAGNDSTRKRFGFLMLPIRPSKGNSFFNTVIIFTPKPGLFSETKPGTKVL